MSKKKILLVETSSHYKIIPHLYKMLSHFSDVDIYCPCDGVNHVSDDLKSSISYYSFHRAFVYFILLFKSKKYDYVYLSTGPQYVNAKNGIFILFCYILFVVVYYKKIILQVRDSRAYIITNKLSLSELLFTYIRSRSLYFIKYLAFESKTLRKSFLEKYPLFHSKCFSSYVYYSDLKKIPLISFPLQPVTRIGVLGMVSNERKNYNMLESSINLLSEKEKSCLVFRFLGACYPGNNSILAFLAKNKINIEFQDGYISDADFEFFGSSCDILITFLSDGLGYGVSKGTGSFGDAVFLQKLLIVPSFADPLGEFSSISLYYKDSVDLSFILKSVIKNPALINLQRSAEQTELIAEITSYNVALEMKKILAL
jgi:hypothetical protein